MVRTRWLKFNLNTQPEEGRRGYQSLIWDEISHLALFLKYRKVDISSQISL